jgi:branched-chain amino acid transport system substrate-binding protein
VIVVALIAVSTSITVSSASVPTAEEGVTNESIKVGFVYSATGVAASIYKTSLDAFQARVDRQNAQGGVNGRKIIVVSRDDATSGQNLTAAQDLVQNEHVFTVVNESGVAFLAYRWLLDHGVPMVGNGQDGTYYQQKGNENVLTAWGNSIPYGNVTYDTQAKVMKQLGAKNAGVVGYATSTSSVATAKAFTDYAAPKLGLDPVYTNTTVDFGTSDVGPLALGLKNAGADAVSLLMVTSTNVALAQALQQNGVQMKAILMATGYGQEFLDSPAARSLPDTTYFGVPAKPIEVNDSATKRFQADLKRYAKFTGVPDYGMYTGYILADFTVAGLERAGKNPTRQGFVDGARGLGTYDQAGLACKPVDVSAAGVGKAPSTGCSYMVQLKDGKFVAYPKNGKAMTGKLVGSREAVAAATSGEAATTTTGGAPPTAAP